MNAQPMGFYPPATLVRDGQRRGVEVIPPDVNASGAHCAIVEGRVVVGLGYVRSIGEADAEAVVAERERRGPFASVLELAQRTPLAGDRLSALVSAGACDSFGKPRRELLWELGLVPRGEAVGRSGGEERQLALPLGPTAKTPELPEQTVWERMLADYGGTGLSVGSTRWSSCARTCRPGRSAAPAWPSSVTGAPSPSRAWSSRASGRRPRTASSSCCSRTSTATST